MIPVVLRIRYHYCFQGQLGNQILFTRSGHPWPSTAGQISPKPSLKNIAAFYGISLLRHAKEQKSSGFDKTHRKTSRTGSRASRLDAPPCLPAGRQVGGEESRPYNQIYISQKLRPVGGELHSSLFSYQRLLFQSSNPTDL